MSEATGSTIDPFLLYKGQAVKITTKTNANVLDAIEAEGWKLEHVGYTYMITKTESTAKAITSGQREAVSGILMGVYIFRRREQVGD
ncbi:MAG: hypothetical protein QY327_06370 [Fimbriimonadaceae bacterium]|nr:MAG: hypothetical protein QY327_06370 [Fimbriimonadaceae bacterium]